MCLFICCVQSFSQNIVKRDCISENIINLPGVTINNFPIIDGSDLTEPLRRILMCKLLGFDYEWIKDSPFCRILMMDQNVLR